MCGVCVLLCVDDIYVSALSWACVVSECVCVCVMYVWCVCFIVCGLYICVCSVVGVCGVCVCVWLVCA